MMAGHAAIAVKSPKTMMASFSPNLAVVAHERVNKHLKMHY